MLAEGASSDQRSRCHGRRRGDRMPGSLRLTTFKDVDLADDFFDSLKAQYAEFPEMPSPQVLQAWP